MTPPNDPGKGRAWVAIILAIGIATAVNLITFAVLYDAIASKGPGLSENATQVLTAAFGGIVGVLGAYVGYQAGQSAGTAQGRTAVADELHALELGNGGGYNPRATTAPIATEGVAPPE